MMEAIFISVLEKAEIARRDKRRVSVSGMLKKLGVSRSGYHVWLKHIPSNSEKHREAIESRIQQIYDDSKQNYGAPKITQELSKSGETIFTEHGRQLHASDGHQSLVDQVTGIQKSLFDF